MEHSKSSNEFPADLCEWVPPATLRLWVEEELKVSDWQGKAAEDHSRLVAVLAFAYARGTFDSEEISDLCRTDDCYRSLCAGRDFSLEEILGMPHKARGILVMLMIRLLTRAVASKQGTPATSLDPALKRRLHEIAVVRLDNAIVINQEE